MNVSQVASLGMEVFILVLGWSPLVAKLVSALWFGSENKLKIAVLSHVSQSLVVKHNKQFKQIRNAWHFGFESALVITAQWSRLVAALLTT